MEIEIFKETKDSFDSKYVARFIGREPSSFEIIFSPFHPLKKYYLQILNTETGEAKTKKVGNKRCMNGKTHYQDYLLSDYEVKNLVVTQEGLVAELLKTSFVSEKTKTFFIPRNKFPN